MSSSPSTSGGGGTSTTVSVSPSRDTHNQTKEEGVVVVSLRARTPSPRKPRSEATATKPVVSPQKKRLEASVVTTKRASSPTKTSATKRTAPSKMKKPEATMESMEVTREQHLRQTLDETASKHSSSHMHVHPSSAKSPGSRKGVKARFVDLLKPKRNRGMSAPVQQQQQQQQHASQFPHARARSYSSSSAPAMTSLARQPHSRSRSSRATTPNPNRSLSKTSPRRSHMSRSLSQQESDNISTVSDNITVEGLRSVATNQTISSVETVKASNKTDLPAVEEDSPSRTEIGKSPWNAFKRALKPFKTPSSPGMGEEPSPGLLGRRANRRRIQSYDNRPSSKSHASSSADSVIGFTIFDQSVRGRFDGLDVMSLGSALRINESSNSLETNPNQDTTTAEFPWADTRYTVTGQSTRYTPAQLVQDMLWNSGGRAKPEIILEGYLPGPEDRWIVQIERTPHKNYAFVYALEETPDLQAASTDENTASTAPEDHEDSPLVSSHKLWTSLWGSDPIPSGQPSRDLLSQVGLNATEESGSTKKSLGNDNNCNSEDPLLSLAANSSIPIDIDEDTFIVSTRDHLTAIQDIASVPISEGRFDTAVRIFEKLVMGLPSEAPNERKYLRGAALHNMGVLHMWEGNWSQANAVFHEALKERRKHMTNHMDLAVTRCRKAQCLFALEKFDEAVAILETCLVQSDEDGVVRAKVLNNLAVVHYHKGEVSKALRYLAAALEIQREWLDGDVRRESIVYDASVSLSNMGKLYLWRDDFELCSAVYEEALLLQTSIFQKGHPAVMQAYINLAWSKALNGHSRTGLRLLESCLRLQTLHYGAEASTTVDTCGWMAHLYARAQKYKEALPLYQQIRQWQKQHLKSNSSIFFIPGSTSMHTAVRLVKDCIKQIEQEQQQASKSTMSMWL